MKRVAVTGIGAVTPVGNDVKSYWAGLTSGTNGIDYVQRFDTTDLGYRLAGEVKDFHPENCMDRMSVKKTDRFVQFAICAAQEAVDDSGILENIDSRDLGVYFGSSIGGFETLCNEHINLLNRGAKRVSPMFIPKMISNIGAGNIAIRFNANGPCVSVSTACATGTTAIGEAYRAIKHGYAKAIICGGSEAAITPLSLAGFGSCMALNPSEDKNAASVPFDKRHGGFVMGEGAGALILEEYEHAKARGAKIYAEVCGYGSTCDAFHITAPEEEAKESSRAIFEAAEELRDLAPEDIYVNAHGTGTPLNDKTETKALKKAFGEDTAKRLHISSTKSMTGHLLGAAGAIEAIAAIMALKEGIIPPTINLLEPDEECDLNYTPNKAVKADIKAAISTSLGFGGHNACVAFKRGE